MMFRRTILMTGAVLVLSGACAWAQTDPQAYCAYLTEQAKAQSDLLRTPNAVGILTQPETGLPTQVAAGLSLSLANVKKSGITLDVARKNCDLYKASTGVQQYLQYAVAAIEREALEHRLELIGQASASLEDLTAKTQKMVEAQNMTRPMLWELEANRIKLAADKADTESRIAAIYVPELAKDTLKAQVAAKESSDIAEQRALAKLTRQNDWDVALSVGAHQQVSPFAGGVGPYGEVSLSYNLASRAIDRHLDRSVDGYAAWKKVQEGDTARNAEQLRAQIVAGIAAQEARVKALDAEAAQVRSSLATVSDADTTAALDFRNQLTSTQVMLGVESGDAAFRLARLREFLAVNF